MILLVVGFAFRSIRLFESVSTGVLARMERNIGRSVLRKLEAMYAWCDLQSAPYSLKRTLLYWPLLATRWTIKVGWDFTTSMYFEVSCSPDAWLATVFEIPAADSMSLAETDSIGFVSGV
jgi:hypothetical protein